jgi:hypothetical protein
MRSTCSDGGGALPCSEAEAKAKAAVVGDEADPMSLSRRAFLEFLLYSIGDL